MKIDIRPATTIEHCEQIEQLIGDCWGGEGLDNLSVALIMALIRNKGIVLIAWEGRKPVGFTLSFPTFANHGGERLLKQHSHMTAVLVDYRNSMIGARLKGAQRAAALAQGIEWITWTYDPLQTRNANINLRKLGAVSCRYIVDAYGMRDDKFNSGLPTDRFEIDWWLTSSWVVDRQLQRAKLDNIEARQLNAVNCRAAGWPRPGAINATLLDEPYLTVAVPLDIQVLRQRDRQLALAWRMHTRELFQQAFAADYSAIDLRVGDRCCFYLLEKEWAPYNED